MSKITKTNRVETTEKIDVKNISKLVKKKTTKGKINTKKTWNQDTIHIITKNVEIHQHNNGNLIENRNTTRSAMQKTISQHKFVGKIGKMSEGTRLGSIFGPIRLPGDYPPGGNVEI